MRETHSGCSVRRYRLAIALVIITAAVLVPLLILRGGNSPKTLAKGSWAHVSGGISGRAGHTAVWDSSEVIVFGGYADEVFGLSDGGLFNPTTRSWRKVARAPLKTFFHAAVWTGREMLVWGGELQVIPEGARFDPQRDTWRSLPLAPIAARLGHTAVWTGREMLVWGGASTRAQPQQFFADGAAFDPTQNRWRMLPRAPLAARFGHSAVWTGKEMIIYGGQNISSTLADGAAFDPAQNRWRMLPRAPLAARFGHSAVWTGKEMVLWGGGGEQNYADGAAFDPARNRWRSLSRSPLRGRLHHIAVWTGTEMIVWGGEGEGERGAPTLADGASYDPVRDTWAMLPKAPLSSRSNHRAVWTGRYLVVIDGSRGTDRGVLADVAIYSP